MHQTVNKQYGLCEINTSNDIYVVSNVVTHTLNLLFKILHKYIKIPLRPGLLKKVIDNGYASQSVLVLYQIAGHVIRLCYLIVAS